MEVDPAPETVDVDIAGLKEIVNDPRISSKNLTEEKFRLLSPYSGMIALFLS